MLRRILLSLLNTLFPGSASLAVGKKGQAALLFFVSPLMYFLILRLMLIMKIRILTGTVISFLIILSVNWFVFRPDPRLIRGKKRIAAAVVLGLFSFMLYNAPRLTVGSYHTFGLNMYPAMDRNQYIGVDKIAYIAGAPQRFDVVSVNYFSGPFVSRIIGLPGEEIRIESNRIYINGTELPDPYAYFDDNLIKQQETEFINKVKNYGPYKIPANNYFVLGDNRYLSKDSRNFGTIPRSVIIGKAVN